MAESAQSPQTFETIFHTYKNRIYNFSLKMLGDRERAADITQDVFVRLFEQLRFSQPVNNPLAWLIIAARNHCLNTLRSARITRLLHDTEEAESAVSEVESSQSRQVRAALNRLDIADRDILILREYERFSYEEIARMLGITIPAVRSRLYKARLALREAFLSLSIKRN